MKSSHAYFAKVFSTGFVVLVLLSLPLFWLRTFCEQKILNTYDHIAVNIQPSGLMPGLLENDANFVHPSRVSASRPDTAAMHVGIVDIESNKIGSSKSNFYWAGDTEAIFFDKGLGLVVYATECGSDALTEASRTLYAGPAGIADTPTDEIGRFEDPMVANESPSSYTVIALLIYDRQLRQAFIINFTDKKVTSGPVLAGDDDSTPVRFVSSKHEMFSPTVTFTPPQVRKPAAAQDDRPEMGTLSDIAAISTGHAGRFLLIVRESGRIDKLDSQTLEFAGQAGFLPAPRTLFAEDRRQAKATELLGYNVLPLSAEGRYLGLCVAALSRDASALALSTFDEDGTHLRTAQSTIPVQNSRGDYASLESGRAIYRARPWAPACTTAKYLLENLQSPVLLVASYFTADRIDALAGHRSLLVLPNSFLAMFARGGDRPAFKRSLGATTFMLPAIFLAFILTWRVSVNARKLGLSRDVTTFWQLATLAFGLPAYITYHLTKPRMTLVTCPNCGQLRRPDQENCHRCRSEWQVPELNPPLWRIKDTDTAETPAPPAEHPLPAQSPQT